MNITVHNKNTSWSNTETARMYIKPILPKVLHQQFTDSVCFTLYYILVFVSLPVTHLVHRTLTIGVGNV